MIRLGTGQLEDLRLALSHPEFTRRYGTGVHAPNLRDKIRRTPVGGDVDSVNVEYEEALAAITALDYYRTYAGEQWARNSAGYEVLLSQIVRTVIDYENQGPEDERGNVSVAAQYDEDDDYENALAEESPDEGCQCDLCTGNDPEWEDDY